MVLLKKKTLRMKNWGLIQVGMPLAPAIFMAIDY